nr:uncharacterized protein LOC131788621 [Pocillopora verrucosa]
MFMVQNVCHLVNLILGALSSEFHSTSSTSESPLTKEQWEKSEQQTKIMETAKLEGTSPLIVIPTTGHGKELEEPWGRKGMLPLPGSSTFDLEEKLEKLYMKLLTIKGSSSLPVDDLEVKLDQVFEEIRMLRMEGSFSVLKFSTIDLEKKLAELRMELQRLRMEGTLPPPELFTADLEDELEQLQRLILRREREKGSSHSLFTTIYTVHELRQELEKVKMEALENAMYPTIRSGLAKFDVSLPEELQNYVSYLLNESAKLHFRKQVLQSPRALEELRVAMDKDELKAFLTIHIREGAWQVVLLFTDELSISKQPWYCFRVIYNEDEDEDEEVSNEVIYSSISGILYGWPTEYDPDLITLCKAITNRDWKVTRLILSRSRISDEGLKNLSTALPQSELYSLTLYGNGLQNQGLKHLCEALIISDCHLTSLNVSHNMLGDEGIMHLRDALASVNCRLTTLNVSHKSQ